MRKFISICEDSAKLTGFHVTSRGTAEIIQSEGFLGEWGDVGFGIYFWNSFERAKSYAANNGWDGSLIDPVVIAVQDGSLEEIPDDMIHPDWDQSLYADMLWKPLDDASDEHWRPAEMSIIDVK